jgi:CRISPR-associated protein Cas5d
MTKGIKLMVEGKYACFSRPECKAERMSYDVITPSAARGILEAIYWERAISWKIDKIHVISPIKFDNIRRNEVENKISFEKIEQAMAENKADLYQIATAERQQRASRVLKDVKYVIEAHYEMTPEAGERDNETKPAEIFKRRARKGQCFHQPYFGCREFPVEFELIEDEKDIPESFYKNEIKDLGLMLWDIDFKNNRRALFYPVEIKNGVIVVFSESEVKKCS